MRSIRFLLLVLLSLLAASCSDSDPEIGSETEEQLVEREEDFRSEDEATDEDPAAPGAPAPPTIHPALTELSGQLAIVDGGDVTVANPDGSGSAIVDGQSVREAIAAQPVWSVDGVQLAWSTVASDGISVSVLGGEQADEIVVAADDGNPIFYLQWAPDGTKLLYLRNAPTPGVEAGVATVGVGLESFGIGSPFYVSWAPSSDSVLAHVGGVSNGSAGEVLTYEPAGSADPEVLLRPTIPFTAPAWLDETTILGAVDGGLAMLNTATGEADSLVATQGPIQFVVSPDGNRVAYRAAPIGGVADGESVPLRVLDITTGTSTVVLERDAIAWEWSPAGDRLAVLGPETASGFEAVSLDTSALQSAESFRWFFWDEQIFAATPAHIPSQLEASGYLPFFEQFAQSHHRWSGDGVGFAFAGTVAGQTGIWVQIAEDETTASLVARGGHVTWSPLSAAIGGGRSIQ